MGQNYYSLGNYSDQLGLDQEQLRNAYTASGGNPYEVRPMEQAPQDTSTGLSTMNQMQGLAGGGAADTGEGKKEKKSGLDNAMGIVGSILSFL